MPNTTQKETFEQWIGTCRYVYNLALETRIYAYRAYGISLSKFDLIKQLPEVKKEFNWVKNVHSQSLQDVIERMDLAYQSFFRGGGFPKWVRKGIYNSFAFKQGVKLNDNNNKVFLPKIGWVKFRNSGRIIGKIKRTTIIKEHDGFYICITHEIEHDNTAYQNNKNHIGIDMGVTHFATTSEGKHYANPLVLKKYQKELRIAQRSLARKKKFGSNWNKQKKKITKLHSKIARCRKDYQHKVANELLKDNRMIVVENLKLKNMSKSAKGTSDNHGVNVKAKSGLNKAILDASIGSFFTILEYKCSWNDIELVKVDPKYSSQECNSCGHVSKDNRNKEKFSCTECGHEDHSDVNAAKNILVRASTSGSKSKAAA